MQTREKKATGIVDTESFVSNNRAYYFDIKESKNQKYYLRITRRDQGIDDNIRRSEIIFFEEDIAFMVEAMAMLLGRYSAGQLGVSA